MSLAGSATVVGSGAAALGSGLPAPVAGDAAPVVDAAGTGLVLLVPSAETFARAVGTFLVAALFYTVTLHLAATFVLGDVSVVDAIVVGPVPALFVVAGAALGPAWAAALLAIPADFLAIRWSYDVEDRLAVAVTVGHVVASVLLAASLFGLLQSLAG